MRQLFRGLAVAAIATVFSTMAFAGNQEVAELIARNLRESGKLSDYKIGVKYQDGTAWLSGRVRDEEQMGAALKVASSMDGITRVVNNLEIGVSETVKADAKPAARPETGTSLRIGNVGSRAQSADNAVQTVAGTEPTLVPAMEAPRELEFADQNAVRQVIPRQPVAQQQPVQRVSRRPVPISYTQQAGPANGPQAAQGQPQPMYTASARSNVAPVKYDQPCMPNYAWPSYAAHPNYAAVTYPQQYSPQCWPYIGPFYPYPQVPMGWRKVTLEWDDGWWWLDFKDTPNCRSHGPAGRWY